MIIIRESNHIELPESSIIFLNHIKKLKIVIGKTENTFLLL